jgi:hypothetical protein
VSRKEADNRTEDSAQAEEFTKSSHAFGGNAMKFNRSLIVACLISVGVAGIGIVAAVLCGGEPPAWLLRTELGLLCGCALVYGYGFTASAVMPVAQWLWSSRAIRGGAYVCLGVGAAFVPVQFVFAAFLIGAGTRMVIASVCAFDEDVLRFASVFATITRGDLLPVAKPAQPQARAKCAAAAEAG